MYQNNNTDYPEDVPNSFEIELNNKSPLELVLLKHQFRGKHYNKQKEVSQLIESLSNFALFTWYRAKTVEDLISLNVLFVQGLLYRSISHLGPLDPESNDIQSALLNCCKLDCFTNESQPYYKDNNVKQYPYISFFYWKDKSSDLIDNLTTLHPTATIYQSNNKKLIKHGNNSPTYLSEIYTNNKWVKQNKVLTYNTFKNVIEKEYEELPLANIDLQTRTNFFFIVDNLENNSISDG